MDYQNCVLNFELSDQLEQQILAILEQLLQNSELKR